MQELKRKGVLTRDEEGSLILVNEQDKGFRVDEIVAVVWSKSDGKTIDSLTKEIASEAEIPEEELKPHIENIVKKLKEADLIE